MTKVMKEKVEMVPLSQILNKFDVRIELDNDRVVQFAGLYEGGVNLPPVRIVKLDEDTYAYIDGRTRGAARAYLNLKDVPAVICNGSLRDNPIELFAEALESNWGGSKPPSGADIIHSVLRMLELGATQGAIRERLNFIPSGAASAYISSARSVLQKRRLTKALDAVAEGVTVETASSMFKCKLDRLKNAISGKKGTFGAHRSNEQQVAIELKGYISRHLLSANTGISKKMTILLTKVEEGEVSAKVARSVIKAWSEHCRKTMLRIEDWDDRLDSISSSHEKSATSKAAAA